MILKKILLVDDVNAVLELEKTFLKRSGCQIITAKSGTEALKKIRSELPDLVFLDLIMPDMSGDKVCESVKQDEELKGIPIIMVSTSAKKEDIERCRKTGCDDYLTKPINQRDLLNKAAQMLKIPQREALRVFVQVSIEGEVGTEAFYGVSENISIMGMLVKSKIHLKEGSLVQLRFLLPGQQYHIEVKGEVIRTDKESFRPEYGLGIAFRELDSIAKEMIENFLNKSE